MFVASYNAEWLHVHLTLNHMAYMMDERVETSGFIVV